jgi:hypothetical protein
MKKRKSLNSMRAAVGMAIATLLTTCLIGGTLARYTASAGSVDVARVAYWGFDDVGTIDLDGLFSPTYTNVTSSRGDDVIAPGTEGQASFAFTYQPNSVIRAPEVAYTFTVGVEGECDDAIKVNPNIQFKLDDGAYGTFDELISAVKALSGEAGGTKQYAAGELPAAFGENANTHTVSWRWLFTDTADPATQDALDTALGNDPSEPSCEIRIAITATQID